jgi:hypothetical protein
MGGHVVVDANTGQMMAIMSVELDVVVVDVLLGIEVSGGRGVVVIPEGSLRGPFTVIGSNTHCDTVMGLLVRTVVQVPSETVMMG